MVDPLSYLSFQLGSTTGVTKDVVFVILSGSMVHVKEPLLLIEKSSPCGGSRFPLSLSEWSFTICLMPYNRKYIVLSVSLNKTLCIKCKLFVTDRVKWIPQWLWLQQQKLSAMG